MWWHSVLCGCTVYCVLFDQKFVFNDKVTRGPLCGRPSSSYNLSNFVACHGSPHTAIPVFPWFPTHLSPCCPMVLHRSQSMLSHGSPHISIPIFPWFSHISVPVVPWSSHISIPVIPWLSTHLNTCCPLFFTHLDPCCSNSPTNFTACYIISFGPAIVTQQN